MKASDRCSDWPAVVLWGVDAAVRQMWSGTQFGKTLGVQERPGATVIGWELQFDAVRFTYAGTEEEEITISTCSESCLLLYLYYLLFLNYKYYHRCIQTQRYTNYNFHHSCCSCGNRKFVLFYWHHLTFPNIIANTKDDALKDISVLFCPLLFGPQCSSKCLTLWATEERSHAGLNDMSKWWFLGYHCFLIWSPVGRLIGSTPEVDWELHQVSVCSRQHRQQLHEVHSPNVTVRSTMKLLL